MEKLSYLPVNLQEAIIHSGQPTVTNTIVAFLWKSKKAICIRKGLQPYQEEAVRLAKEHNPDIDFKIIYGDSFTIDTWDNIMSGFHIHNEKLKKDFEDLSDLKDYEISYHGHPEDYPDIWELELMHKDRGLIKSFKYYYSSEKDYEADFFFLRVHLLDY